MKYIDFFETYKSLSPCAYATLRGLRSFKTQAGEFIREFKVDPKARKDPSHMQGSMSVLYAYLENSLEGTPPGTSRFFTETFQDFIVSRIRNFTEVGIDWETCALWSSVYLLVRRFIVDARDVFASCLTPSFPTAQNGGDPSVATLRQFLVSNVVLEPLVMRTIEDWEKAHVAALEDRIEFYEREMQYAEFYDTVRQLMTQGLLRPRGDQSYEKTFEETMGLLK